MKELEEQESILFSAGSLFFLLFWFLWHVNQTFPNQAAKQILILYDIFLFLHGEKQMTKLNTWFVRKRWVFLGDIWMPLFECLLSVKLKICLHSGVNSFYLCLSLPPFLWMKGTADILRHSEDFEYTDLMSAPCGAGSATQVC